MTWIFFSLKINAHLCILLRGNKNYIFSWPTFNVHWHCKKTRTTSIKTRRPREHGLRRENINVKTSKRKHDCFPFVKGFEPCAGRIVLISNESLHSSTRLLSQSTKAEGGINKPMNCRRISKSLKETCLGHLLGTRVVEWAPYDFKSSQTWCMNWVLRGGGTLKTTVHVQVS